MKYYINCWRNYANFRGRARRTEFWLFVLFTLIIFVCLFMLSLIFAFVNNFDIIPIFAIASIMPFLAVTSRRLQDADLNPLLTCFLLIPIAGLFLIFIFAMINGYSNKGENYYGPDPKVMANVKLRYK